MLAGISTACFYPELTERGLSYIAGLGAQAAEVFFNAPSELDDGYLRELRRTADGGGTRILSVHPFTSGLEPLLFFSDYRRRFADGIAFYQRYFHAANLLGAKLFVFHGDRRNTTRSRRFYFDRFAELCEAGRRMGVTVCAGERPALRGLLPRFLHRHARLSPRRAVRPRHQAVRAGGYSPGRDGRREGEGLVHLHVSDHGARGDCLPLGAGELDLAALLGRVRGYGFDGRRDARALPRQLRRVWGAR